MLPLITVSPREAYLEQRVSELEAEVSYLRAKKPYSQYSVMDEPETIAMPSLTGSSIRLPVVARSEVTNSYDGLHVMVKEVGQLPKCFALNYCISWAEIESARDRAGLIQFLHERTLKDISRMYFA